MASFTIESMLLLRVHVFFIKCIEFATLPQHFLFLDRVIEVRRGKREMDSPIFFCFFFFVNLKYSIHSFPRDRFRDDLCLPDSGRTKAAGLENPIPREADRHAGIGFKNKQSSFLNNSTTRISHWTVRKQRGVGNGDFVENWIFEKASTEAIDIRTLPRLMGPKTKQKIKNNNENRNRTKNKTITGFVEKRFPP